MIGRSRRSRRKAQQPSDSAKRHRVLEAPTWTQLPVALTFVAADVAAPDAAAASVASVYGALHPEMARASASNSTLRQLLATRSSEQALGAAALNGGGTKEGDGVQDVDDGGDDDEAPLHSLCWEELDYASEDEDAALARLPALRAEPQSPEGRSAALDLFDVVVDHGLVDRADDVYDDG